jgi:hypothetical protein
MIQFKTKLCQQRDDLMSGATAWIVSQFLPQFVAPAHERLFCLTATHSWFVGFTIEDAILTPGAACGRPLYLESSFHHVGRDRPVRLPLPRMSLTGAAKGRACVPCGSGTS